MVGFNTPYWVSVPVAEGCEVVLVWERMEEVEELKYLGTVLCKHEKMEEVRE